MYRKRTIRMLALGVLALGASLLATPHAADAHVRVFIGGPFGPPVVAPYPYYYGAPYPYPYPYPYYDAEPVPPPGFVRGRWEWRWNRYGHRYRVWVPAHLY